MNNTLLLPTVAIASNNTLQKVVSTQKDGVWSVGCFGRDSPAQNTPLPPFY